MAILRINHEGESLASVELIRNGVSEFRSVPLIVLNLAISPFADTFKRFFCSLIEADIKCQKICSRGSTPSAW